MAKLVISHNGMNVRDFPLQGERVTIGRNTGNDIMLNEPIVSGEHAAILLKPKPTITDLGSTNGTRLNNHPISKSPLKHNDVIKIGSHELCYVDEDVQDFAATMIMFGDTDSKKKASGNSALKILNGPRAGEVMKLEKERTALGKPGMQVAVVMKTAKGYELLPITTGDKPITTSVNGKAVKSGSVVLKNGDEIAIADARLGFIESL
ncbi:MAG: FHA domain-containing protein [Chromatiales bacterium]|nr:FHA domain-containing protein [Chromatiales bacterium]